MRILQFPMLWVAALLCANTGLAAEDPVASGRASAARPDFSGNWERDFARSDRWEDELQRTLNQWNRLMNPGADSRNISSSGRGAGNVVANARLAELITRQTTIEIEQDAYQIRIKRRGDADLVCSTANSLDDTFSSRHGSEYCGWDRSQLVFEISLESGVYITYRFSVDASRENLSMMTTVSDRRSIPFNLRQFFYRYDAPADAFDCVQTISRGQVCSMAADPDLETAPEVIPEAGNGDLPAAAERQ